MTTIPASEVRLMIRSDIVLPHNPVADAWYAAHCPPDFNARAHVTFTEWLRWRLALAARRRIPVSLRRAFKRVKCGALHRHRWIPSRDAQQAWCWHCQAHATVKP